MCNVGKSIIAFSNHVRLYIRYTKFLKTSRTRCDVARSEPSITFISYNVYALPFSHHISSRRMAWLLVFRKGTLAPSVPRPYNRRTATPSRGKKKRKDAR